MIILSFLIAVIAVLLEGRMLCAIILHSRSNSLLEWTLGYPLGALLNALLFFVMDTAQIPWTLMTVAGAHIVLLLFLAAATMRLPKKAYTLVQAEPIPVHPLLYALSFIVLIATVVTTSIHALTIPSIDWDSFTNWAMRAKMSFVAGRFVTDNVTQPQYPVLLHSLEMLPMYGAGFTDQLTKAMSLLLSLSGLAGLWVLGTARVGKRGAVVILAFLCAVPFAFEHLRQGYADIHWTMYALLSAITLDIAVAEKDRHMLALSVLLVAAAGWTKLDALYFAVLPWLIVCLLMMRTHSHRFFRWPIVLCLVLSSIWPIHVLMMGSMVSPHHTSFAWHPEAIKELFASLFTRGTFGVYWWVIGGLTVAALLKTRTRHALLTQPSMLLGMISAFGIVVTYLCTSEVSGLLQGDNFSRVMLGATMLLTLAFAIFSLNHTKKGA